MPISLPPPPRITDLADVQGWLDDLYTWLQIPERPCFAVTLSGDQTNIAVGSLVTVQFDTEIFDIGSNFDTTTYTFTAPITGKYLFTYVLDVRNIPADAVYITVDNDIGGTGYYTAFIDTAALGALTYWRPTSSNIYTLNADDDVLIKITQSAGTQQTDIDSQWSYFSGALIAR